MSVMYLVDMAKTVIDQSLSGIEAGTAGQ